MKSSLEEDDLYEFFAVFPLRSRSSDSTSIRVNDKN